MLYWTIILLLTLLTPLSYSWGKRNGNKSGYNSGFKIGHNKGEKEGIEIGRSKEASEVNEKSESYKVGWSDGVLFSEFSRHKTLEKLAENPTRTLQPQDLYLTEQEIDKLCPKDR